MFQQAVDIAVNRITANTKVDMEYKFSADDVLNLAIRRKCVNTKSMAKKSVPLTQMLSMDKRK